jgi:hypothetical protein
LFAREVAEAGSVAAAFDSMVGDTLTDAVDYAPEGAAGVRLADDGRVKSPGGEARGDEETGDVLSSRATVAPTVDSFPCVLKGALRLKLHLSAPHRQGAAEAPWLPLDVPLSLGGLESRRQVQAALATQFDGTCFAAAPQFEAVGPGWGVAACALDLMSQVDGWAAQSCGTEDGGGRKGGRGDGSGLREEVDPTGSSPAGAAAAQERARGALYRQSWPLGFCGVPVGS